MSNQRHAQVEAPTRIHREHCHRRFGRPGVRRRLRPTRQIHPGVSDRLDPPGNVFGEAFGHALTTGTYSKEEGKRDGMRENGTFTDIDTFERGRSLEGMHVNT